VIWGCRRPGDYFPHPQCPFDCDCEPVRYIRAASSPALSNTESGGSDRADSEGEWGEGEHGLKEIVRCPGPEGDRDFQFDCRCGWKSAVVEWEEGKVEFNCHLADHLASPASNVEGEA